MVLMGLGLGCDDGGGGGFQSSGSTTAGASSSFIGNMELLDYGTVSVSAYGRTGTYTLSLPEGASGFSLIADGTATNAIDLDLTSLIGPGDDVLITESATDVDPIGKNSAQNFGETAVAMTFPSAIYSLPAGDYTFLFSNFFKDDVLHVYGIINHRSNPAGGTIDVNIILVSIPDYTGVDDPNLAVLVEELRRIYALQNVALGSVNQFVLDRPDLTDVSVADDNGNGQFDGFDALIPLSKDIPNHGINYFLVQSVGQGILGLSGGIPGPALIQGTLHSGVVISLFGGLTQLTDVGKLLQGGTMAHEGGHYMGLYHPTERNGKTFDALPDTPKCDSSKDTNGDGIVSALECVGFGESNLMFWAAPPASSGIVQDQLTHDQKYVLQRNPMIHD